MPTEIHEYRLLNTENTDGGGGGNNIPTPGLRSRNEKKINPGLNRVNNVNRLFEWNYCIKEIMVNFDVVPTRMQPLTITFVCRVTEELPFFPWLSSANSEPEGSSLSQSHQKNVTRVTSHTSLSVGLFACCPRLKCHSREDDHRILIETSSCNLQLVFSELIMRDFHAMSPQVVFTLLTLFLLWTGLFRKSFLLEKVFCWAIIGLTPFFMAGVFYVTVSQMIAGRTVFTVPCYINATQARPNY